MALKGRFFDTQLVNAADIRAMYKLMTGLEGVTKLSELKVVQRAAGANKSVDVGTGAALINGDYGTTGNPQYTYHLENTGVVNLVVADNTLLTTRKDIVVARIYDTNFDSSGLTVPTIEIVQGSVNNTDPAIPSSAIPLARLTLAQNFTQVLTANITDMRQRWLPGDYMSYGYLNGYRETTQRGPVTTTETQIGSFTATILPNRRYKFCAAGFIGGTVSNDRALIRIRDNNTSGTERVVGGAQCEPINSAVPFSIMRNVTGMTAGTYTFAVTLARGALGSGSVYANYGGTNEVEAWVEDMGDLG